jgi:hypothetical protein
VSEQVIISKLLIIDDILNSILTEWGLSKVKSDGRIRKLARNRRVCGLRTLKSKAPNRFENVDDVNFKV